MISSHRQLVAFINGRMGDITQIATLPIDIGKHIGVKCEDVHVKQEYARKIFKKHRLLPHHFYQIQITVNYGWVGVTESNNLVFLYEDTNIFGVTFKLVIKTIPSGEELWLKTFHKVRHDDVIRLFKKCRCVRKHY